MPTAVRIRHVECTTVLILCHWYMLDKTETVRKSLTSLLHSIDIILSTLFTVMSKINFLLKRSRTNLLNSQ